MIALAIAKDRGLLPQFTTTSSAAPPLAWREWLEAHFGHVCTADPAPRMVRLWEWFEALSPGIKPPSRVEVWPRGGAKSSVVELACARLAVRGTRRFALIVSGTQEQADKHVAAVADHLERLRIGRAVNPYGHSRGWRRSMLRTATGFNIAAFGLDTGARGVKLGDARPDLMVFDDVDDRLDTEAATEKKLTTITQTLLPAGAADCAVLFVQNRVHAGSVAAQLADGKADFLHDREPVCEEAAIVGLEVEQRQQSDGTLRYVITAGTPTWAGQGIESCQRQINEWGLRAFRREAQHETDEEEGGLWSRDILNKTRATRHPDLSRIVVGVDPNATEGGDEAGIVVAGCSEAQGYVIDDATMDGGPKRWAEAAVAAYHRHKADCLVAESNNGGEMVAITIGTIAGAPPVKLIHASRGKLTRAEPIAKMYFDGRIHHVGHFSALEREMCTWAPGMPSPNRMDAAVWSLTELMLGAVWEFD